MNINLKCTFTRRNILIWTFMIKENIIENIIKKLFCVSHQINSTNGSLKYVVQLFKSDNMYFVKFSKIIVIYKTNTKYQQL